MYACSSADDSKNESLQISCRGKEQPALVQGRGMRLYVVRLGRLLIDAGYFSSHLRYCISALEYHHGHTYLGMWSDAVLTK